MGGELLEARPSNLTRIFAPSLHVVTTLRNRLTFAAQIGVLMAATTVAQAAAVHYSESVDGDLPSENILPTLAFDIGVNTVNGRFGAEFDYPAPPDRDSFAFTVPSGTRLVVVGQVALVDFAGDIILSDWKLSKGSAEYGGGTTIDEIVSTSPGSAAFKLLPLGPGLYAVSQSAFASASFPPSLADYVFTFTVVPEPATAALLAIGSTTLWLATRRRRQP